MPDTVTQLTLIGLGWLLYRQVRLISSDEAIARANAKLILDLQEALNISFERTLNSVVASVDTLAWVANWHYLLHFPVTIGAGL